MFTYFSKSITIIILIAITAVTSLSRAQYEEETNSYDPQELFETLNSGWPEVFSDVQTKIKKNSNYVLVTLIPPKTPIDFRSADNFRKSFFLSSDPEKNTIGHTVIGWQCLLKNGSKTMGMTAQTGEESEQFKKMLRQGWGGTTFLSTTPDGYLQTPQMLDIVFNKIHEKGHKTLTLVFEVEQDQCISMLEFLKEFVYHPNQPLKTFGLTPNPEKFEGAGCGSFGTAMLKAANALPSLALENIYRNIKIPNRLIGQNLNLGDLEDLATPFQLSEDKSLRSISILSLLNSSWKVNSDEPYTSLHFVDPEMFILAIRQSFLFAKENNLLLSQFNLENYILDRRTKIIDRASSFNPKINSPPRTKFSAIDYSFDPQAKIISDEMTSWLNVKKDQSNRFELSTVLNSQVLIIQK
jgi:hypothetical protein